MKIHLKAPINLIITWLSHFTRTKLVLRKVSRYSLPLFATLALLLSPVAPRFLASRPVNSTFPSSYSATSNTLGQTGQGGVTAESLSGPRDNTLDAVNHRLFVADYNNSRVLVYDLDSNNQIQSQTASFVLGQPNFTTSNTNAGQAGMAAPKGVIYDSAHNRLFVADTNNARVLVFDTTTITNGMPASYVLGQPNFTTSNTNAGQAGISNPNGVAYDTIRNRLFVSDISLNRVLVFDTTTITNGMPASFVLGQPNFTSSSASAGQTGMSFPAGVAYDATNNRLFVAELAGSPVLTFDFAKLSDIAPSLTLGVSYTSPSLGSQTQGTTTYSVSTGNLPTGLGLDTSTGILSGTPTTAGTYNFSVHLADDNGTVGTFTVDHSYSLVVPAPPVVPPANDPATATPPVAPVTSATSAGNANPSAKSTSTPVASPANNTASRTTPPSLDLDSQVAYSDSSGYTVTAAPGDVLTFTTTNAAGIAETHTITVGSIDMTKQGDPTVSITVNSKAQTFTLRLNHQQLVDANSDGTNDIGIVASNITSGNVALKIWKIAAVTSSAATTPKVKLIQAATFRVAAPNNTGWYVGGGIVLLAGLGATVVLRRSRVTRSKP
jgi:Putative Ig domain